MSNNSQETLKVRLDKWLWAARFFKTRALAKQAIEGGKAHYNGAKSKPGRLVELGAILKIRQGYDEKIIEVISLSEHRRGAPEAALLYQETEQSQQRRVELAAERKAVNAGSTSSDGRPTKKDRRRIKEFKEQSQD
jgi:ribosome-associated heat shock protein Hsp15